MSHRTRYSYSVKHVLIKSFRWWPHDAKEFVHRNDITLEELRAKGLSPYKAADFIQANFGRK